MEKIIKSKGKHNRKYKNIMLETDKLELEVARMTDTPIL
jgi:hypothetical protein